MSPLQLLSHFVSWAAAIAIANCASLARADDLPAYPVKPSANGQYLVDQKEKPFLIAGESPQAMMVNVSELDAELFFANRASHGFNTVWINLLCAKYTGGRDDGSTFDGIKPFEGNFDFAKPNEKYFARCDHILKLAAKHGLLVMLDPAETGSFLEVMQHNGSPKCRDYGRWLGNRYAGFDNLLWFHGNDYNANTPENDKLTTAVALGIKEFDKRHLHTIEFDVRGGPITSLSDERWTSIVGLSGSYTYGPVYVPLLDDYNRKPAPRVPRFMMESSYEFEQLGGAQLGTPRQLRWQEYTSNLCGSTGQLYGNKYTWPFLDGWKDKLDTPGAVQMKWVKKLFEPRKWCDLVPDQQHKVVTKGFGTFGKFDFAAAAITSEDTFGTLAIVYVPDSRTITVDLSQFPRLLLARWYDPSSGKYQKAADAPLQSRGEHSFKTPGKNSDGDADWVFVIETEPADLTDSNSIDELRQAKLKVVEDWDIAEMLRTWGGGSSYWREETICHQARAKEWSEASDEQHRIEARQLNRDMMEETDKKVNSLAIALARGGEPDHTAESHYLLSEATHWLEKAKHSPETDLTSLQKQTLQAAEEWRKAAITARARPFQPDPLQEVFAARAVRRAEMEMAASPKDRIAAAQNYYNSIQEFSVRESRRAQQNLNERTEIEEPARYYLLDATIALKGLQGEPLGLIAVLRRDRLDAADRWLRAAQARVASEKEPRYLPEIIASRAVRDAQFDLSAERAGRIGALKGYLERMQKLFDSVDALAKAWAIGGESYQLDEVQYELLEAKCLLLEEESLK